MALSTLAKEVLACLSPHVSLSPQDIAVDVWDKPMYGFKSSVVDYSERRAAVRKAIPEIRVYLRDQVGDSDAVTCDHDHAGQMGERIRYKISRLSYRWVRANEKFCFQ